MKFRSILFFLATGLGVSFGAIPDQVHFQGRLTDGSGNPVNGSVQVLLRVYDAPVGGSLLYAENVGSVTVTDGLYNFAFGSNGTENIQTQEVLGTGDGATTYFWITLSDTPVDGTISVSDGTYTWTQAAGSSDPANFIAGYNSQFNTVEAGYATAPAGGVQIVATYDVERSLNLFTKLTGAQHYLELEMDGDISSPRTLFLAVPFALRAKSSEISADTMVLAEKVRILQNQVDLFAEFHTPAGMVFVQGTDLDISQNGSNYITVDSFWIGKFEVQFEDWIQVRQWGDGAGYDLAPYGTGCGEPGHPVGSVNWYDAVKWCNAKSEMEGLTPVYYMDDSQTSVYRSGQHDVTSTQVNWSANGYRLPTSDEWRFAGLGGYKSKGYAFSGSDDELEVGWFQENSDGAACDFESGRGTWPVGLKPANELGIHDMSGNVFEWCFDVPPLFPSNRFILGGCWRYPGYYTGGMLDYISAAPDSRQKEYGFRIVRRFGM